MQSKWILSRDTLTTAAIMIAFAASVLAQKPSSGSSNAGSIPSSSGSLGNTGVSNPTSRTTLPNQNNTTTDNPQIQTGIFLSGTVLFDDGSKPSTDIVIERICSGNPRPETHVDSKGRFSFQVGQSQLGYTDASVGLAPDSQNISRTNTRSGRFGDLSGSTALSGCDLRASYPGYRSDTISLTGRHTLDNPNVGTIVLHRLEAVHGTTISLTTALAPKHAQKEFEKGLQSAQKGHTDDAEKHLAQAVDDYPKYALAWYQLGQIQQEKGDLNAAKKSYKTAIEADSKYVSPYDQLTVLALQDGKWQDADEYSKQVISLNPVEFPSAFFYSALAEYNLKKLDDAEKNAKQALKIDERHRYPQTESLLAQVLLQKGNYAEAAQHLRAYLALVPNAKNADVLKQQLLKIEQASAAAPK